MFCLSPYTDTEMPNWLLVLSEQHFPGKPTHITHVPMGSHSSLCCGQEPRWGRGYNQRVWFADFIINVGISGIILKPLFLESHLQDAPINFCSPEANPTKTVKKKTMARETLALAVLSVSDCEIQCQAFRWPGLWLQGTTKNYIFFSGPFCIRFLWKAKGSRSNSWYQEDITYLFSVTGPNASPQIVLTEPWALNLPDHVALGSTSDTCLRCLPARFPPC